MSTAITPEQASKPELVSAFRRLKSLHEKAKEHVERSTEMGMAALASTAGGAFAGALSVKMPVLPNTTIPTDLVVGTAAVLASMVGLGGKYNLELNAFGSGLTAVAAARETAKMLAK